MADESEDVPEADERTLNEVVLDALNEYLAGSGMVTAFHLIADFIDEDGEQAYLWSAADGQTQSTTLGLIAWSQKIADHEASEYLRTALDEGD